MIRREMLKWSFLVFKLLHSMSAHAHYAYSAPQSGNHQINTRAKTSFNWLPGGSAYGVGGVATSSEADDNSPFWSRRLVRTWGKQLCTINYSENRCGYILKSLIISERAVKKTIYLGDWKEEPGPYNYYALCSASMNTHSYVQAY